MICFWLELPDIKLFILKSIENDMFGQFCAHKGWWYMRKYCDRDFNEMLQLQNMSLLFKNVSEVVAGLNIKLNMYL